MYITYIPTKYIYIVFQNVYRTPSHNSSSIKFKLNYIKIWKIPKK